jgi:hypothetical protein
VQAQLVELAEVNPKFHGSFITVGQGCHVSTMASVAAKHGGFLQHYNAASAGEIEQRFQEVTSEIYEIIKVSMSDVVSVTVTKKLES